MIAAALLLTFGAAECVLVCFAEGERRALAVLTHGALVAAMVTMLLAPREVWEIGVGVLGVLVITGADARRGPSGATRHHAGLAACALGTLLLLAAMAMSGATSASAPAAVGAMSGAMSGMTTAGGAAPGLVVTLALIVETVFLGRALVNGALLVRPSGSERRAGALSVRRTANIAASLSMIVMCAAMAGGV